MSEDWEKNLSIRSVSEAIRDGLFVLDETGVIVYCNDAMCKYTGLSKDEIIGKRVADLEIINPSERPGYAKLLESLQNGITPPPFEVNWTSKDGKEYWNEIIVSLVKDDDDVVTYIIAIARNITDRKLALRAIRDSETRYRRIFDSAPGAIVVTDSEGSFIEVNQSAVDLFGYTVDEFQEVKADAFYNDSKDRKGVIDTLHRDGKIRNYEVALLKKDGTIFHALLNEDLVRIDDHYLNFAIIRDITLQRLAEEALREERDRAQLYLDIAGVIIVALDREANIILLNKKGCEILDVKLEDVIGLNWIDNFIPVAHREEVHSSFSGLMSGELGEFQSYENPILTRLGDERIVKWFNTILKDESGIIIGTLSSGEDITIAKQVEDALRQSEEQYRITLESMNDAVHVVNKDLQIILMNKAVEELGKTIGLEGDFMYKTIDEAFPFLSKSTTDEYQQIFQSGESQQKTEHSWVKGREIYTDVSRIPIRADGEIRYVLTVIRDMTEQYRAESDTLRAADTAMLYLDLMGHDIRNQLQAISMGVEFLHHMDLGPEATSVLDYVNDTILRSVALITKIHATEELLIESLNQTSLIASLNDSISIMQERYPDVEFNQDISIDSAIVLAGQYLTYLLLNIFENGIVHNPSEQRRIWISLLDSGDGYLLSIADNGPGLTDDSKENLFDPNRRFGGIGVHQAKKISERYNATLSVHDRVPDVPSEGADFRLWLPRAN